MGRHDGSRNGRAAGLTASAAVRPVAAQPTTALLTGTRPARCLRARSGTHAEQIDPETEFRQEMDRPS
jgi:hypothetical protein